MNKGEIIIYQTSDGKTSIDVKLEEGTVWLTQAQIALLFGTKRPAITKHLSSIYENKELIEESTCSILEHVGNKTKQKYNTKYYNLDAILSVGYRVNSKNATQFRIWANSILKNYLINGFAMNQNVTHQQLINLHNMVQLFSNVYEKNVIDKDDAQVLLRIIKDYSLGLKILDEYDYQKLKIVDTSDNTGKTISYKEALKAIKVLKEKLGGSELFGREKDESFKSSLSTIYQTFEGRELYSSIEEKAAMLLYFMVFTNQSGVI